MTSLLRQLLGWLLALLILFEEWGWVPLQRAAAFVARLPPLAWIEHGIAGLPPYAALSVFALPTLALLPVKLAALWLLGNGHAALGVALVIAAKVVGTAVVARLYALTRPALTQLAWFALWHGRWIAWKERLLADVRASRPWRVGRVIRRRLIGRRAPPAA